MKFVLHFESPVIGTFRPMTVCCHYIQNLQEPGEDRPEARSISLSVSVFRSLQSWKEKLSFKSPRRFEVFVSPGAPLIKLKQSLEFGALEGGDRTPHSLKDILVETSTISLEIGKMTVML